MPNYPRKLDLGALVVLYLPLTACASPEPDRGSSDSALSSMSTGDTGGDPSTGDSGTTGQPTTAPATTDPSGCAATHPRIGWRAELVENYHGVAGTAEIVDDCTIVVNAFSYDGTGIDVRFYAATDEDYAAGFAISDNLLKPGGYAGETMVLALPPDRSLDDLDGLSVWCVDVEIDFGSGVFTAP